MSDRQITKLWNTFVSIDVAPERAAEAESQLVDLLHDDICRMAKDLMSKDRGGRHPFKTSDLFQEAFFKILGVARMAAAGKKKPLQQAESRKLVYVIFRKTMVRILGRSGQRTDSGKNFLAIDPFSPLLATIQDKFCTKYDISFSDLQEFFAQNDEHPVQKEVFVMHYLHGLTFKEIAERIGKTPKTVKKYCLFYRMFVIKHLAPECLANVRSAT